MSRVRVAVVADLLEERWPSMDLVAEMLAQNLASGHSDEVDVTLVRPRMRRRLSRLPLVPAGKAWNADRVLNRFYDYPSELRGASGAHDVFHVVDHSYAQLVHALPAERTLVTCHDLDAFRCLIDPAREPRSAAFRAMTRRIRSGLERAARVVCVSGTTRDELVEAAIVPADRAVVIPNGVHPSCSPLPDEKADAEASRLLGEPACQNPELLHVGSTVPRKRIDLLLRAFAAGKRAFPSARLIRVGGRFTSEQERLVVELGIGDAVRVLPYVTRETLAAIYRRAALVLQPSDREGFGLPVIEALACGAPVLASDLPVFREIGQEAVSYATPGDAGAWEAALIQSLSDRVEMPEAWDARRRLGVTHSRQFSWAESARRTLEVYREIHD